MHRKHAGVAESVQRDSPQQLNGVWIRSWVQAKRLSEWLGGMDEYYLDKSRGIAVSSQTRTCSKCCLYRVETFPQHTSRGCLLPSSWVRSKERNYRQWNWIGLMTWWCCWPRTENLAEAVFTQWAMTLKWMTVHGSYSMLSFVFKSWNSTCKTQNVGNLTMIMDPQVPRRLSGTTLAISLRN